MKIRIWLKSGRYIDDDAKDEVKFDELAEILQSVDSAWLSSDKRYVIAISEIESIQRVDEAIPTNKP